MLLKRSILVQLLSIITILILKHLYVKGECIFNVGSVNQNEYQPLYFIQNKKNISWATSRINKDSVYIAFKMLERIIIACPVKIRKRNKTIYKDVYIVHCNGYNTTIQKLRPRLEISSKEVDVAEQYLCDEEVNFVLKPVSYENCSKEAYEVGVQISFISKEIEHWSMWGKERNFLNADQAIEWRQLLFFCFDEESRSIIYTKHHINGKSIMARQIQNIVSPLRKIEPRALDNENTEKYFRHENQYLLPKFLIPPEDMLFVSWKFATNLTINTAPIWHSVDTTTLEDAIRTASSQLGRELVIYTGTFVDNVSSKNVEFIQKENKQIRIPHMFWKVVQDEKTNRAIAFIIDNTPYKMKKNICEDICDDNSWKIKKENNSATYCCTVMDLVNQISELDCLQPKMKDMFEEIGGVLQMSGNS